MNKKILAIIILLIMSLFFSVYSFATNDTTFGDEVMDSVDKSKESIQNAGEQVKNITSDIGNEIQGTLHNAGQGMQDVLDGNDSMSSETQSGDYTATRTATDQITGTTMSNTAWVWLILGIVGFVIVALTWYYVSQNTDYMKKN